MSTPGEAAPVPDPPPSTTDLLHDAYHAGLSLAQMVPLPGVTVYVSEKYGLTTSTEVQDPGTPKEYYKAQQLEKILDSIADATQERFRDVEEFASSFEDGTFPLPLARSFDAITHIHAENVHLKNPRTVDGRDDGDIFIEKTIFTVAPGSTELLNTVFNKLLHKNNIQRPDVHQPLVYADEGGDGWPPTITITDVSEHDIRAIGRAVDALVARRFREHEGVRLPANKMSLSGWSDEGHTFPYPSEAVKRMQDVFIKYSETTATATYPDYAEHNLKPVSRPPGPLGTDASGKFQRWRNIINGLSHHLRGSSAHNLEENPNPFDRISLGEGKELKRELITEEQAEHGPGSPLALTSAEVAAEALRRKIDEAKQNKFSTIIKSARFAIGVGIIDLALGLVAKLPKGLKRTGELAGYAAAYREQQVAAKASAETLKHVVWYEVMGPRFRELDRQRAQAGDSTLSV